MALMLPLLGLALATGGLGLGMQAMQRKMTPPQRRPYQAVTGPGGGLHAFNPTDGTFNMRVPGQGPERKIIKGADGRNYYLDGTPVLPNVQTPPNLEELKTNILQGKLKLDRDKFDYKKRMDAEKPQRTPEQELEQVRKEEEAKAIGKSNAEFRQKAPNNLAFIDQAIETAERVVNSPYLKDASGWSGILGLTPEWAIEQAIPQESVDIMRTDLVNLKGSAAFEGLRFGKGAGLTGTISNYEIKLVENAMANIDDPAISYEAKLQQVGRFLKMLRTARGGYMERMKKLGIPVTAPADKYPGFKVLSIE